jgi:anaerobic ribonucleoside-triphosphate reductase activating protein
MGGEWHPDELVHKLATAKELGFDTCLYTGQETVSDDIKSNLTWLKTGPWVEERGGLTCPTTNQRFVEVKTNKLINNQFLKTL